MVKCIADSVVEFIANEGRDEAFYQYDCWLSVLSAISECGNPSEKGHADALIEAIANATGMSPPPKIVCTRG